MANNQQIFWQGLSADCQFQWCGFCTDYWQSATDQSSVKHSGFTSTSAQVDNV